MPTQKIKNSLNIIKKLAQKDKRVRYCSFSKNFGKESGIYAGLENSTGNLAAIMDVDLQDPPSMLIEMYQTLKEEDCDCVALYATSHDDYSFIRKNLTNLWYKVSSKISVYNQRPGARDFRLMKREMVDAILEVKEYNRYIKGIFGFIGFTTKWIGYVPPKRTTGKSKFNIYQLTKYALEGLISSSTKPLLIATYIGLLFCIISFLLILLIIIKTLIWGDPVSGWPSLACLIIFMGGIQLFFLGIIGMYLSKIYLETKKRPLYIIKETEKGREHNEK